MAIIAKKSQEIEQVLRLLHPEGAFELRALTPSGVFAGVFTDHAAAARAAISAEADGAEGVFVTLNPVKLPPTNQLTRAMKCASDADVVERRWLLVDLDVASASADARALADRIIRELAEEEGWPEPIVASSGHGIHLLWKIQLPNEAASTDLVRNVLSVLAIRYDEDGVHVDTVCFNAARLVRLYGTLNRHPKKTPAQSRLIRVPQSIGILSREQLERVASQVEDVGGGHGEGLPYREVIARLGERGMRLVRERPVNGYRVVCLDRCLWGHADRKFFLVVSGDRVVKAACWHASCGGRQNNRLTEVAEALGLSVKRVAAVSEKDEWLVAESLRPDLQDFRFVPQWQRWLRFDGKRWREAMEEEVCQAIHDALLRRRAPEKMRTFARTQRIERCARVYLKMSHEGFDADPWLFNCLNGTLDLRTFEFREHRREDFLTRMANAPFDPEALCPAWLRHLERIFPNPDLRRLFQRSVGVALVGETLEERLYVWYGRGANGKSVTANVLLDVLGDYAMRLNPKVLTGEDSHPTGQFDFRGRRLVISQEVSAVDVRLLKELTGGDRLRARRMRADYSEFKPSHTLVLVCNERPRVPPDDDAIWRRLLLILFGVEIPPHERRPQFEVVQELRREAPGILLWAVDGLRDWMRDRHWLPASAEAAVREWREENDLHAIDAFRRERLVQDPFGEVEFRLLYAEYAQYARERGCRPLSETRFGRLLSRLGIGKRIVGGQVRRTGIRLRSALEGDFACGECGVVHSVDADCVGV